MSEEHINMLVSKNIEALMSAKNTNALQLANKAGINKSAVYDIIAGRSRSPKIETIQKIAIALNVPISMIFSENMDQSVRQEIVYLFDALPENEQIRLIQTAKAWLPPVPS